MSEKLFCWECGGDIEITEDGHAICIDCGLDQTYVDLNDIDNDWLDSEDWED